MTLQETDSMARKKGKTESVQAREERLAAERAEAAAKAAALQAAAEEAARLEAERKAAKAEKWKKVKRPRFVREVVAKTVAPKPKPLPPPSNTMRGKIMTKNVVVVPKDESTIRGGTRPPM